MCIFHRFEGTCWYSFHIFVFLYHATHNFHNVTDFIIPQEVTNSMEHSSSYEVNSLLILKKFPAFYGILRLITMFTRAYYWIFFLSHKNRVDALKLLLWDPFYFITEYCSLHYCHIVSVLVHTMIEDVLAGCVFWRCLRSMESVCSHFVLNLYAAFSWCTQCLHMWFGKPSSSN